MCIIVWFLFCSVFYSGSLLFSISLGLDILNELTEYEILSRAAGGFVIYKRSHTELLHIESIP